MPFLRKASFNSTILGCTAIFNNLTYRMVVFFVCAYSSVSLNFFIATNDLDSISLHLSTTP